MNGYSLGIDTSNYKTSVALVDKDDNIIYDERVFLDVPKGALGLRQQDALFQHIVNLPKLLEGAFAAANDGKIEIVSASNKPRPASGSYMPCFLAGENQAKVIASLLECQLGFFSHQEGHLLAATRFTELKEREEYIFFHFSGGTTEILKYNKGEIEIIGNSLDISFGQLLDRVGSAMEFSFPAGERIDEMASQFTAKEGYQNLLPRIKIDELNFNLSGIETATIRLIDSVNHGPLSYMLMERVLECIEKVIEAANAKYGIKDYLFAGGVSSSHFIRNNIGITRKKKEGINIHFSDPRLSSDNAVGIAFLGGDKIWRANQ